LSGLMDLLKVALSRGRVTLRYPTEETPTPEGLRGRPVLDFYKCIGCGACAAMCPPNALTVDEKESVWTLRLFYGRCLMCGLCEEVCPVDAFKFTKEFELASTNRGDLEVELRLKRAKCEDCGRYWTTERLRGEVDAEYASLGNIYDEELREMISLCPECRRKAWSETQAEAYRRARYGG